MQMLCYCNIIHACKSNFQTKLNENEILTAYESLNVHVRYQSKLPNFGHFTYISVGTIYM